MQGQDQEAAGAGTEKAVIDAHDEEAERRQYPVTATGGERRIFLFLLGHEGGQHGEGQQEHQHLAQQVGRDVEGQLGADTCPYQRKAHAQQGQPPEDEIAAGEVEHGHAGAQAAAHLVGAQGQLGRQAGKQQGGDGDEAAAARDGIDEARYEGGAGTEKDDSRADHATIP